MRKLAYGTSCDDSRTEKTGIANKDVTIFIQTENTRYELTVQSDGSYTFEQWQGKAYMPYGFQFHTMLRKIEGLPDGSIESEIVNSSLEQEAQKA
jgi:hypothetical protein